MVTRWTKAKAAVLSLGSNVTNVNDHGRPDDIFKLFSTHFTLANTGPITVFKIAAHECRCCVGASTVPARHHRPCPPQRRFNTIHKEFRRRVFVTSLTI